MFINNFKLIFKSQFNFLIFSNCFYSTSFFFSQRRLISLYFCALLLFLHIFFIFYCIMIFFFKEYFFFSNVYFSSLIDNIYLNFYVVDNFWLFFNNFLWEDVSFLGILFMWLVFFVFLVVWFYGFYNDFLVGEVLVYFILEILSFILFFINSIIWFIIILEVSTILLLYVYISERPRRVRAMGLLFFYTLISGSFLVLVLVTRLVGFIDIYWYNICVGFLMVFALLIKLPIFPFHFWLPEAHAEATTSGSLILAGVILKMGFYGFMKFVYFELLLNSFNSLFIGFLLFSIFYLFIAVIIQYDIKKIIAYSSVIHMQVSIAVLLLNTDYSYMACLLLVLNHGLVSVGLFLCASIYINCEGTRNTLKWYYSHSYINGVMLCLILSNMGFPFTIGFFGEFLACVSFTGVSLIFLFFFLFSQLFITIYNLRLFWLVSVNEGPYFKLIVIDNFFMLFIIYIILGFNFFLFILFSIYV